MSAVVQKRRMRQAFVQLAALVCALAAGNWRIDVPKDATDAQRRNLKAWLTGR